MLALHRVEQRDERAKGLRQREEPQRVTSGGGVDDDATICARRLRDQVGQREQRKDLVGARQCRVDESLDVTAIQIRAAIDDLGDGVAPLSEEFFAERAGIELPGVEVRPAFDAGGRSPDLGTKNGRQRGRGIGREQQCAFAASGEARRNLRRSGRLADAAFSDDERGAGEPLDQQLEPSLLRGRGRGSIRRLRRRLRGRRAPVPRSSPCRAVRARRAPRAAAP